MTYYADPFVTLLLGDCVERMAELPAESVDAVVTDPPYGLEFMGKTWDRLGATTEIAAEGADVSHPFRDGSRRVRFGASAVTMQSWHQRWATEAYRVAKPGAHLLAFGGTRTYHRLASAIEDAGWEIRDCLVWGYASGFPKSKNLPGGLGTALKPAWEPIVMARKPLRGTVAANVQVYSTGALNIEATRIPSNGSGNQGRRGEASPRTLCDDCVSSLRDGVLSGEEVAEPDQGQDVLTVLPVHDDEGAGELAVQGRMGDAAGLSSGLPGRAPNPGAPAGNGGGVPAPAQSERGGSPPQRGQARQPTRKPRGGQAGDAHLDPREAGCSRCGRSLSASRWPANLILTDPLFDGGVAGVIGGGEAHVGKMHTFHRNGPQREVYGKDAMAGYMVSETYGDSGTYSRFFLIPKADRAERERGLRERDEGIGALRGGKRIINEQTPPGTLGANSPRAGAGRSGARYNVHPTVKPIELMRHLVRLVTPPGGLVLDPFVGSGTTALACSEEGFRCIGIDQSADYLEIAVGRLGPTPIGMGLE